MRKEVTYHHVVDTRVPLSLRLPARIVEPIEEYAAQHRLSKTDAFIHFLELGLAQREKEFTSETIETIQTQIEEILKLLKADNRPGIPTQEEIREAVREVSAEYPGIAQVYLFGSFARGDSTPTSDINLRLILDRSHSFNLHDLVHFSKHIEKMTGRTVDVITSDQLKNKNLSKAIEREKVLLYERES